MKLKFTVTGKPSCGHCSLNKIIMKLKYIPTLSHGWTRKQFK